MVHDPAITIAQPHRTTDRVGVRAAKLSLTFLSSSPRFCMPRWQWQWQRWDVAPPLLMPGLPQNQLHSLNF